MTSLVAACALFFLIHSLIAGTGVRFAIAGRIGEKPYRGLFSVVSLGSLVWMAMSYNWVSETGSKLLWFFGYAGHGIAVILVLLAFLFAVVGMTSRNPTSVEQEGLLREPEPAKGIQRITRHPFLVGVVLWSTAHLIANGDLGSVIFFATFLLVALVGMANIDRKRARQDPEGWARFAAQTSRLPFLAIAQGRNRFSAAELGWWRILLAIVLYGVILYLHGWMFGVPVIAH
ncbi:MAG: NnrU family protein [Alphaproteobacteria bacterium]|nr:NnrU family protein [Alphaproteobacteria bacterium]